MVVSAGGERGSNGSAGMPGSRTKVQSRCSLVVSLELNFGKYTVCAVRSSSPCMGWLPDQMI